MFRTWLLHKLLLVGHALTPTCPECKFIEDTLEHVIFECPRFEMESMMAQTGNGLNPDNIFKTIWKQENSWNAVGSSVTSIMTREMKG